MPIICPFCYIAPSDVYAANEHAIAFRDRFPVSPGHTLVIPRVHRTSVFAAEDAELDALWRLVAEVREALVRELAPNGFTIGINDGEPAGQTVLHAHVHVMPRFSGDAPDPRGGVRWVLPERAAYWRAPA